MQQEKEVMRNALFTVFDKRGTPEFAKALHETGKWRIIASGGTAKAIREAGVPVMDVADLVGGGATSGHLVVTSSREVSQALVTPDTEKGRAELAAAGIPFIDLYVTWFYNAEEVIARIGANRSAETDQEVINASDVGGPTNLLFALKGGRLTATHYTQFQRILDHIVAGKALAGDEPLPSEEPDRETFVHQLRKENYARVSRYIGIIAGYWGNGDTQVLTLRKSMAIAYPENRQMAADGPTAVLGDWLLADEEAVPGQLPDPLDLTKFEHVKGAPIGYTVLTDADGAMMTLTHIAAAMKLNTGKVPCIAVGVKHGNACGAAIGETLLEAIGKMIEGSPQELFGGTVITNCPIDDECATMLRKHALTPGAVSRLIDSVWAPDYSAGALDILPRKDGGYRIMKNPALATDAHVLDRSPRFRKIRGSNKFLVEPNYTQVLDLRAVVPEWRHLLAEADQQKYEVTVHTDSGTLTPEQATSILLGSAVCRTSISNTITIVQGSMLRGNGIGQMSRVRAAKLAVAIATEIDSLGITDLKYAVNMEGAVGISDSFFPFPDGIEVLFNAGVRLVYALEKGLQFPKIAEYCKANGITLVTMKDDEARMFARH